MANSEPTKALNLELPAQQSFIRYFNSLPEKPPTTVRFYNRVDYYTVHGDDATLASDFLSLRLKYMGDQPKLSYICLNKAHFESLVRELLLVRQYRVEVYLKSSQNKSNDWNLEYKGSPGNLSQFEELLFENSNVDFTNSVMGVKLVQNKNLAICCVNITEAKLEVAEIIDNESFSELEAILAQIGPRECVIPAGESPDLVSLRALLERNGILTAKVKRSDFSIEEIHQDLNRLLFFHEEQQRNSATYTETNLKEAMGCLQAVIKFLNLTGDPQNFNQFKLGTLDASRYVRLDNAALYALNVLPKARSHISQTAGLNQTATKNGSLKGLLDCCVTSQGHRLLEQWIKQPLKDFNLINDRFEIVGTFVKDAETRTLLVKECLPRLADLMLLSKKLSCKKTNLQDCYRVYQTIYNLPRMAQILRDTGNKCVIASLVDPMFEIISDTQNYQNMIEQTLDLELIDRGEYLVKASFDDHLNELHRKKAKLGDKMQHELAVVADDLGLEGKGIKLECNDQHGYFFRITLKEERTLRKHKNYTILDAVKGGVRFRNDMLTKLNEKYAAINEEYKERQKTIVEDIFEVACGYAECLRNLNHLIAAVDVLTSFAVAAISARIPYARPKLHQEGTGILDLKKVRHPCLEAQNNVAFIPNDASFHKSTDTLHIITGPNMCGKSTYIRSIGICVLMAHIGSFVPCEKAEISIIDGILVRVGAEDCQLKGLSTFMLEMIETSSIIKSATQNSLVIIDELGRGTSTYDGCGIAWAIAEHLVKEIKCFSLFATHYHEITRLAEMYDSVSNLHVTAATTNDTIIPLYQIQKGECDKSYGVHCAKMVGFPEDMIKDAIEQQKKLAHDNGMKYITDFPSDSKRKIVAEGDAIIKETINKMKSINADKMSDSELSNFLTEMKSDLLSKNNLFIKGLICQE